jgi:hypothetical protein
MSASEKLCFVIGPISDPGTDTRRHADWLLQGIIQPVFNAHFPEFTVLRSDQISAPGSISSQIINHLHSAALVIADMSLDNANAFYEMGIRHMRRLPTIHMFTEGQNIPFDVKPYRAIPFKYTQPNDLVAAQVLLKAAVEETLKPDFAVDNPVTQARGAEQLSDSATPVQKVLLDQLESLRERVENAEMLAKAGYDLASRSQTFFPTSVAGIGMLSPNFSANTASIPLTLRSLPDISHTVATGSHTHTHTATAPSNSLFTQTTNPRVPPVELPTPPPKKPK